MVASSWASVEALPDVALAPAGPVTGAFIARGLFDLRAAAEHVLRLPYGRNSASADPLRVLDQQRGTCSTKHALLALLIEEQQIPDVALVVGIYEMSEANTPGVGATLASHGLRSIHEAHCYLQTCGQRIDLTRVDSGGAEPIGGFLVEERIHPG